jgi:hypothetical protein
MANFNASGPIITLEASGSSLLIAALPITTTREITRRSAEGFVAFNESGFVFPRTGQLWPLGLIPCPDPPPCPEPPPSLSLSAEPLGFEIDVEPLATAGDSVSLQFIVPTINIF